MTGWTQTSLGELCDINMGQSPPSNTYNIEKNGLPFFQGKAEFSDLHPVPQKWCSKPQKEADEDTTQETAQEIKDTAQEIILELIKTNPAITRKGLTEKIGITTNGI